jgi:hypothetical protein
MVPLGELSIRLGYLAPAGGSRHAKHDMRVSGVRLHRSGFSCSWLRSPCPAGPPRSLRGPATTLRAAPAGVITQRWSARVELLGRCGVTLAPASNDRLGGAFRSGAWSWRIVRRRRAVQPLLPELGSTAIRRAWDPRRSGCDAWAMGVRANRLGPQLTPLRWPVRCRISQIPRRVTGGGPCDPDWGSAAADIRPGSPGLLDRRQARLAGNEPRCAVMGDEAPCPADQHDQPIREAAQVVDVDADP